MTRRGKRDGRVDNPQHGYPVVAVPLLAHCDTFALAGPVRGETGVGKTALLRYVARQALVFGAVGVSRWACPPAMVPISSSSPWPWLNLLSAVAE